MTTILESKRKSEPRTKDLLISQTSVVTPSDCIRSLTMGRGGGGRGSGGRGGGGRIGREESQTGLGGIIGWLLVSFPFFGFWWGGRGEWGRGEWLRESCVVV